MSAVKVPKAVQPDSWMARAVCSNVGLTDDAGTRSASRQAPREDGFQLAPDDDGKDVDSLSVSIGALPRKRGGRSKRMPGKPAAIEQMEFIGDVIDENMAEFGRYSNAVAERITPANERLLDTLAEQQWNIERLQRERGTARLHIVVARGKLSEVRRRIDSHADARYLGLLDDLSSEPSDDLEESGADSESDPGGGDHTGE